MDKTTKEQIVDEVKILIEALAKQLVEQVGGRLASAEKRIDTLELRVGALAGKVEKIDERLVKVEGAVMAMTSELANLTNKVSELGQLATMVKDIHAKVCAD